jgi:hypothetical protein
MDYNLIQSPEMIRTLQQRLGIKQAHVAPTLAEHIQPVVIVDDIPADLQRRERFWYFGLDAIATDGSAPMFAHLANPPTSGVVVTIDRICISVEGPQTSIGDNIKWWISATTDIGTTKNKGTRQVGTPFDAFGVYTRVPGDLAKQPFASTAYMQHQLTNTAGPYIRSINMEGKRDHMWLDMHVVLVPGSSLVTCWYDVPVAADIVEHINYEWEERPIT